jgi:hypothetical protein
MINNFVGKQWSPYVGPVLDDIQMTLPLTTKLLALLPTSRIHPLLYYTFGKTICERGEWERNDLFKQEAIQVAKQFPSIEVFKETIMFNATKRIRREDQRSVIFLLALLGIFGKNKVDGNENVELVAIRMILNEMDPLVLREHVYKILLVLIEWEWLDRCLIAVKVLDAGF